MKKIFTIIAASLMLVAVESKARVGIGVEAGYLNSGRYLVESGINKSYGFNGAYVGADYTLKLTEELSFVPGVNLSFTTGKASVKRTDTSMSSKVEEMYIGIPLEMKYATPITSQLKLFVTAGPVVSFGLMSSEKLVVGMMGEDFSSTINSYKSGIYFNGAYTENTYSPFDVLAEVCVGVEAGKLRLVFGYGYGLLNRYKGSESDCSIKRNQLRTGVAFLF